MNSYKVSIAQDHLEGSIQLSGSKSISNRVLLIRALSGSDFKIDNLSDSDDTNTLLNLLSDENALELNTGHAGTTFRFLTAYLALNAKHEVVLTGSHRMLERPIGPLVEALRKLGAQIEYVGKEGYPPLRFSGFDESLYTQHLSIDAGMSSQYISALLMIAPTLPKGLSLNLEGEIVSRPYIEMTLRMMQYFGIVYKWTNATTIDIPAQSYQAKDYVVESDWSAASYYYALAGLAKKADIKLYGLTNQGIQGDSAIAKIGERFGVKTSFQDGYIELVKEESLLSFFEYDFLKVPDIAQSIAVLCAALGTSGLFTGLQTLRIKETDRIAALQNELAKVQVFLSKMPAKFSPKTGLEYYMLEGKAVIQDPPSFATYHDHRRAMAFAPLALVGDIIIEDPGVVSKSYPAYWEDLKQLGFQIEELVS